MRSPDGRKQGPALLGHTGAMVAYMIVARPLLGF